MTNEQLFKEKKFDQLYEKNQGFIFHLVKKFNNIPSEDVIDLANMGFCKAIKSYSLDKKTKFITYASMCMTNEILMYFRKTKKINAKEISLNETLYFNNRGESITLEDIIIEKNNNIDDFMEKNCKQELIKEILGYLKTCSKKEQQVFKLYIEGKNQTEIAKELNNSQSYISRIIAKVIKKIKKSLRRQVKQI